MEIKMSKADLLSGLSLIQGIVERKTTMPILSNVLLEAKGSSLTFTATDLEVGLTCIKRAEVESEGRIAMHARGLYDIVRELSDDAVRFKVMENQRAEISCGRARFKIAGLAADEFPALPKTTTGVEMKLSTGVLHEMIEKTAFAMSTDETRFNLNGVLLEQVKENEKEWLRMVATDGHRLSMIDRNVAGKWKLPKGIIVPRKGVMELKKLTEGKDSELTLLIDDKHMIVKGDGITLLIRLIDGQFPPYKQVMPTQAKRVVGVEREPILHVLKRVSVLATDRTRGVKFAFSPKNLEVSSSNPDFGEAKEEMNVNYKGEKFEVGFNARYFIDVLNVFSGDEAQLQMGDDTTPCILKCEKDLGFTHIVMPMRL